MSGQVRASAVVELLILRRIRACDPAAGLDGLVDVVVERGRITRIGPDAADDLGEGGPGALVVDRPDLWVLPAFVDLHAHFREPGQEHKEDIESGLAASAAGGYAHVCVMPNTSPVNDTPELTQAMCARAAELGGTQLHPVAAITLGLEGHLLTDALALRRAGAVALSDDGRCVMSAAVMRRALEQARDVGLPLVQHAEDHTLTEGAQLHEGPLSRRLGLRGWPRLAEERIVARDLQLLAEVRGRYHVAHVSTEGTARLVREAKARGLSVTAEVTPHHLLLTDAALLGRQGDPRARPHAKLDTSCKVNPPLREPRDVAALRAALADGTIDAIATDHAPHSPREKDCDFAQAASGMIGLELVVPMLLPLVHQGALSLDRFVDALTRAPAGIVGLAPPTLRVGALAELCVLDPMRQVVTDAARLRSKSRNSPLLGRPGVGSVELTVAGGVVVYEREGVPGRPIEEPKP
jgi:dihydroorotase